MVEAIVIVISSMPNGFHGSDEAWRSIEAPLQKLDPIFEEFANRHHMTLARNSRNWPSRSLSWRDNLERKIEIYLQDEREPSYGVWVAAWQYRSDGGYYLKTEAVAERKSITAIKTSLPVLLEQARQLLSCWSEGDLVRKWMHPRL